MEHCEYELYNLYKNGTPDIIESMNSKEFLQTLIEMSGVEVYHSPDNKMENFLDVLGSILCTKLFDNKCKCTLNYYVTKNRVVLKILKNEQIQKEFIYFFETASTENAERILSIVMASDSLILMELCLKIRPFKREHLKYLQNSPLCCASIIGGHIKDVKVIGDLLGQYTSSPDLNVMLDSISIQEIMQILQSCDESRDKVLIDAINGYLK